MDNMKYLKRQKGIGANQVLFVGVFLVGLMLSSLAAVDIPVYLAAQNQLQTAVDAAALAGAAKLPIGQVEAEIEALDYALENSVLGQEMDSSNFEFNYNGSAFEVSGEVEIPTLMSKLTCGLSLASGGDYWIQDGEEPSEEGAAPSTCTSMTLHARSKAIPAARDVILVIDTSGSMNNLGNGQPFNDVKDAALAYVDQVIDLDSESIDRIGVVTFDFNSTNEIELTSTYDSNNFQAVKDTIDQLDLYNGSQWWNTNYHSGLQEALDELETNGRQNASKTIVFLTDGYPNVPDGPDWYYKDCINAYSKGNTYTSYANYYYSRGYTSYGDYYSNKADEKYDYSLDCTTGYTDYMVEVTLAEADRAADMDVAVHTIQIGPPPSQSGSLSTIRAMLQNDDWDALLLDQIADITDGEQYTAETNDGDGIMAIYNAIAEDVHMRLAL